MRDLFFFLSINQKKDHFEFISTERSEKRTDAVLSISDDPKKGDTETVMLDRDEKKQVFLVKVTIRIEEKEKIIKN